MGGRGVGVRGALVHEHSSVLARLWPQGCAPADLLPSLLVAQCGACAAVAALRCPLRSYPAVCTRLPCGCSALHSIGAHALSVR